MSTTVGELVYIITADNTQFKAVLQQTRNAAAGAGESIEGLGKKVKETGNEVETFGKKTQTGMGYAGASTHKVRKEVDSLADSAAKTSRSVGAMNNTLRGIGYTMATFAAVNLFQGTIKAASDLNEALTLNKQVFQQYSSDMQVYSKNAADSIGLSNAATLQGTSILALFAKNTGSSTQESVKFSQSLTNLASDMASALNTSVPDALTAINAALRGEQIPIRRYGVLLDDLTLKGEAMAQGVYDGIGPLTAQQRTMAAYAQILKQTTDIQGDFARTADLPANSWRRLTAAFTNFQADFANTMIPLISNILAGARGMLEFASNNMGLIRTLIQLAGIFAIVKLAQAAVNAGREFAVKHILAETAATSASTSANGTNATSHMTVTAALKARTAATAQLAAAEATAATTGIGGIGRGFVKNPGADAVEAVSSTGRWRNAVNNSPLVKTFTPTGVGNLKDLGSSFATLGTSVRGLAPLFSGLASALLPVIAILGSFIALGALKTSWDVYTDQGDRKANEYQMNYIGEAYNQNTPQGKAFGFVGSTAVQIASQIPILNSVVTPEIANAAQANADADAENLKINQDRAAAQALEKKNQDAIQKALKDRLITESEAAVLMNGNMRKMDAMAEIIKVSQKNFGAIATGAKELWGQFNLTNEFDDGMVDKEIAQPDGSTTTIRVPRDISQKAFMEKYGPRAEQAARIIADQTAILKDKDLQTDPVYEQLRDPITGELQWENDEVGGKKIEGWVTKSTVTKEDLALMMDFDPSGAYLHKTRKLLQSDDPEKRQRGLDRVEDVKKLNSSLAGELTDLSAQMQKSFVSLFDWLGAEGGTMMWETSFELAQSWSKGWINGIETNFNHSVMNKLGESVLYGDDYLDQVDRGSAPPAGYKTAPFELLPLSVPEWRPAPAPTPLNANPWSEPPVTEPYIKNNPSPSPASAKNNGSVVYSNNTYILDSQKPSVMVNGLGSAFSRMFMNGGDI